MDKFIAVDLMYFLMKRRIVILSSFVSFVIGCTVTVSLLNWDNCQEKHNSLEKHEGDDMFYVSNYKKEKCFLVILILTSPSSANRRAVIRETWLSLCNSTCNVKHYFVIGSNNLFGHVLSSIQNEQSAYGDLMLLPNVVDNYTNLTRKVIEAFVWLHKTLEHFEFVLKCDDDSFIQINKIVSELQAIPPVRSTGLYWGFFNGRAQVKYTGKWKEPGWLLCDYYLPYALGGGYILSQKLVRFIASNAQYLRLYNSEDVSVGVWVAALADVNREHDPRFDTEFVSRGCSNNYLVTHKHDDNSMKKMYSSLKSSGHLCETEYKSRKSYVYNWNVPPSKCCMRNNSNIP